MTEKLCESDYHLISFNELLPGLFLPRFSVHSIISVEKNCYLLFFFNFR